MKMSDNNNNNKKKKKIIPKHFFPLTKDVGYLDACIKNPVLVEQEYLDLMARTMVLKLIEGWKSDNDN